MTAPTLTAQEVFDIAVGGVLKQGVRCLDPRDNTCVYRGPKGMKCAAGFVFTDEEVEGVEYVDDLDSILYGDTSASAVIAARAPRLEGHEVLLDRVQSVHDLILPENWPQEYRCLAKEFDLSTAVIDQWEASQ